jgi:hypothetical protein
MAIYQCPRDGRFAAPVGVTHCLWCQERVEVVELEGAGATDETRTIQRARILIDRLSAVLYGPGLRDDERVRQARLVMETMAPHRVPNGMNGKEGSHNG